MIRVLLAPVMFLACATAIAQPAIDIRTPTAQRTVPLAEMRRLTFTGIADASNASMIIRYGDASADSILLRDVVEITFEEDGAFSTMTTKRRAGTSFTVDVAEITLLEFPSIPSTAPLASQTSNGVRVYPNPFVSGVTIEFPIAARGGVELEIVDARGILVRSLDRSTLDAGTHTAAWDGNDAAGISVPSGTYYFVARSLETVLVHALVTIR